MLTHDDGGVNLRTTLLLGNRLGGELDGASKNCYMNSLHLFPVATVAHGCVVERHPNSLYGYHGGRCS